MIQIVTNSRRKIQKRVSIKCGLVMEQLVGRSRGYTILRNGVLRHICCVFVASPSGVETLSVAPGSMLLMVVLFALRDDFSGVN